MAENPNDRLLGILTGHVRQSGIREKASHRVGGIESKASGAPQTHATPFSNRSVDHSEWTSIFVSIDGVGRNPAKRDAYRRIRVPRFGISVRNARLLRWLDLAFTVPSGQPAPPARRSYPSARAAIARQLDYSPRAPAEPRLGGGTVRGAALGCRGIGRRRCEWRPPQSRRGHRWGGWHGAQTGVSASKNGVGRSQLEENRERVVGRGRGRGGRPRR